ncbi:hypothetical protein DSCA_48950 [Desulfosarcina alkanivorans]|uniref:Uncharacterized protein n=2 Tax=Desulfosarcina alkanivorans TaxID=571177 RepID=A0A5K7YRL2_9BACT|nr:hypothetical protein DSCA_48950 [Desulfosarcina alkanivorans]
MASAVRANIITSGDVSPDDPGTWTSSTRVYIGDDGTGRLAITEGSMMAVYRVYIGHDSGSIGTVTVDGEGSTMTNSDYLVVGDSGTGTLAITDGGSVTNDNAYIGWDYDAIGAVTVDGEGSAWSSSGYIQVGDRSLGTLAITNGGSVTSSGGYIAESSGSTGTVTVDGVGSTWADSVFILIGEADSTGTLKITNGGSVNTVLSSLGIASGSVDTAIIDGVGSTWTNSSYLSVGCAGTATMSITNGGAVTSSSGQIGWGGGGKGTVTVDGSTWTMSESLLMGYDCTGELSITNGGTVTSSYAFVGYGTGSGTTIVTVDVDSELKVGSADDSWKGTISNIETIRLVAGAGAGSGTYTPMSYGTMEGDGSVQALGGVWDETAHTITVSDAVTARGAGGATASLVLTGNQRALITDSGTGKAVGASFMGGDASTAITLTATAVSGVNFASLESRIAEIEEKILSAWSFSTDGYTVSADHPVYLSLYADSAGGLLSLTIWHRMSGEWIEYDASGLTFDGTYASFTVTELGEYAVTAASAVPTKGMPWIPLLLLGE